MSFKTLNIGMTALLTQKAALDVTGQNIANAATPGYARQRVITKAVKPELQPYGAIGAGVEIKTIKHLADEFLEKQVRIAVSSEQGLATLQDGYENLEAYFNELTENDLSTAMDDYWNTLSDFSSKVEDVSTRRAVLERAKSMRDSFRALDAKLFEYQRQINDKVVDTVENVNGIINDVGRLNVEIVRMESGGVTGVTASDLRDQRTEALKTLSEIMDITVNEDQNGALIVSQGGRMLVFHGEVFELATREIYGSEMRVHMPVFEADQEELRLGDGSLWAQIELRDQIVQGFRGEIDQLAASLIWETNRVHSQGIGLKGYTDLTGTTSVDDPEAFLDDIEYQFTPVPGTFEIENGNLEIIVHNTVNDEDTVENIEIDLDDVGTTDTTLLELDAGGNPIARCLVAKLQAAFDEIRPNTFEVSLTLGNKLRIRSTNDEYTFGFGRDSSGVLAALGMNTFFQGFDAGTIDVNTYTEDHPEVLAGARSFVDGDNTGALALLELRETNVLENDSATFDSYYMGIVGRLGIEAGSVDSLEDTAGDIRTRMENQREDLSGVNLDEELTKMIQYQRSFQSAARFIQTVDTVLETLINM